MSTTKTLIETADEVLAEAAQYLGTTSTQDTVNAALRDVAERFSRLRAFNEIGAMADDGYFDEFAEAKSTT